MPKSSKQETTDVWVDAIGREFRPGDLIAVATINGRSPQMVIARVERINTTNPKGVRHTVRVRTGRKVEQKFPRRRYIGPELENTWSVGQYAEVIRRNQARERDPRNWEAYEEILMVDEYEEQQTVTVTVVPVLDGRGFYRSTSVWDKEQMTYVPTDKSKSVTYQLPGNIVRISDDAAEKLLANLDEEKTRAKKHTHLP